MDNILRVFQIIRKTLYRNQQREVVESVSAVCCDRLYLRPGKVICVTQICTTNPLMSVQCCINLHDSGISTGVIQQKNHSAFDRYLCRYNKPITLRMGRFNNKVVIVTGTYMLQIYQLHINFVTQLWQYFLFD